MLRFSAVRWSCLSAAMLVACADVEEPRDPEGGGGEGAGSVASTNSSSGITSSVSTGGSVCEPGTIEACYSGPADTDGVGACKAGSRTCAEDGSGFGDCVDEVLPSREACATPADEDCDGLANEEGATCVCVPGEVGACYTGPAATQGVGICQAGTHTCEADGLTYGACTGEVLPAVETCATTADDDCDGLANEEGTGCVCAPSAAVSCYEGPAGTAGVGECASGLAQCSADGTSLGACVGQALPSAEYCVTPLDEDCDGDATTCTGTHVWTMGFSANVSMLDWDWTSRPRVRTDAAGNVIIGTGFKEKINLGGDTFFQDFSYGADVDLAIAKLDGAGNHIWSRHFGGEWIFEYGIPAMAVDNDGNVIFAGPVFDISNWWDTLDFGGGPITGVMAYMDMFVVKLDADGNHVWSQVFGSNGDDLPWAMATDAAGNIVITGQGGDGLDFGGGPLGPAGGFVVKLNAAGEHVFSKRFNASDEPWSKGAACDAAGNVALTGSFIGTTDFGGGVLNSAGSSDVYMAKLDPLGNHLWSNRFGNASAQSGRAIAFDASGSVVLAGDFQGTISFGGATLTSAGDRDAFVATFDASGDHVWSKRFGGSQVDYGEAVAIDASNGVVLVGTSAAGTIDFGGGPLSGQDFGAYVVLLDPSGDLVWGNRPDRLTSYDNGYGQAVATDPFGGVYVAGQAASNFAGAPYPGYGWGYVTKLTE